MLSGIQGIAIAFIGAAAAVTGSFFTAQAQAGREVREVDTKVQVLERTQQLQYSEIKEYLDRFEKKLDSIKK